MDLIKSQWETDENTIRVGVPIQKVDRENRLVSGFATLDNIDKVADVVESAASRDAFAAFQGNIREMHQPIAAGRLVDFREDSFYDSKTQKFYNGIYVTAYVSTGAEDTWKKVLDGTLSGFSIGGNITEQSTEFVKDAGRAVRFIKAYTLAELSLVDNPCNQFANVFSITKSAEGTFMKGMIAETEVVNVFWCPTDEIAKNSSVESETCLSCGSTMELIGWFEKDADVVSKVANTVAKFLRQREDDAVIKATAIGEGGVEMANEITKDAEGVDDVVTTEVVEGTDAEEAVETNEVETDETTDEAEAAEVVETETDPDFEKMFDDFKDSVKDSIEKTVKAVEERVEKATKAFDDKASEFEKSLGELSESLQAIKTEREDVAKRLDSLESATAIKKSGEVETTSEPVTKSAKKGLWSGAFFDGE